MSATRIVLLGTGTPNADPDRMGACTAVVVGDRAYLVDCGPGVVRRAEEARRRGVDALAPANLSHLFVTHHHVDHTAGYADLLYTPWVLGRPEPLRVIGPPGTEAMTSHLLDAYEADRVARVEGLEPIRANGYGAAVRDVPPGRCFEDDRIAVDAVEVSHGTTWRAYSYRFETADGVAVVSGDTRPHEAALAAWAGCDLLVHEVYATARLRTRPPEWRRYHASMHTSAAELGAIASRVGARRLVLTHVLLWGATPEEVLAEVREGYPGRVEVGRDLGEYPLP